ncbi:phospholipase C [Ilyonectria robusta]|uniref:phospholipase C n=1 Tax=Ilyonectria robusta TaxID=1079257 RepID=UPI001E8E908B|nr:phospholipase C [Ilyonectria robusta]KAH8714540.1 phospholipase C [Ilyonectria robusta]
MHPNYILLLLTPFVTLAECYRGYQSAYSFDADLGYHPRWMQDIPDEVLLSSLSIPGTHDTMSYSIPSDFLRCQNLDLSTQLNSGIRYFDIRARLRDNELHIYHAHIPTGFSFASVLTTMFEFLTTNPSETIIMRLKEEGGPMGRSNTVKFVDAFNHHRHADPRTAAGAAKHFFNYVQDAPLPMLGDLRSKIFIIQQFPDEHGLHGLKWRSKQMVLQDYWITPSLFHLADKWSVMRDAIELAAAAEHDNSVLYLAHASTAVGVLPIDAAAGTANRTITGMNDMTGQWIEHLENIPEATRTGIVVFDFPGRRLVESVLRWNEPLKSVASKGQWLSEVWAKLYNWQSPLSYTSTISNKSS